MSLCMLQFISFSIFNILWIASILLLLCFVKSEKFISIGFTKISFSEFSFLSLWGSIVRIVTYQFICLSFFFLFPFLLASSEKFPQTKISYLYDYSKLLRTKPHLQPLHTVPIILYRDFLISARSPVFQLKNYICQIPLRSAFVAYPFYLLQVILLS